MTGYESVCLVARKLRQPHAFRLYMSITISISTRKREWTSSLFSLDTIHFPKLRELAWISDITSSRSLPHVPAWRTKASDSKWCRKFRLSEYFLSLFCFCFVLFCFWLLTAFVSFPSETCSQRSGSLLEDLFSSGLVWSGCLSFSRATSSHPFFKGKALGTRLSLGRFGWVGLNMTPDPFCCCFRWLRSVHWISTAM